MSTTDATADLPGDAALAAMTLPRRVLAVVGASPLPVATDGLLAIVDDFRPNLRRRVWVVLKKLRRAGLVRQIVPAGRRPTDPHSWVLASAPVPA